MNLFSYDSKFSQLLIKLSYSCWLNVLWFACSLPIFTIGASTTALYSVTLKIADDRDSNITKQFFEAFRSNFAQATRLWLIMLAVGLFLIGDLFVSYRLRAASAGTMAVIWTLVMAFLIGALVLYTIVLIFVFPLTASVVNTDLEMLKNSFLIGTRYLFVSITVFIIHVIMFLAVVFVFTPLAIFGEGLCALISSFFLLNVIRLCSYLPEEENTK
ncbi:MAG: YesL family protein [Erysipelotrichaceae bacterium]|nr:YesL family protein [Erysipelotrichaceae bacterium]